MRIESIFNPKLKLTIGALGQRNDQEVSQNQYTLNMRSKDPNFAISLATVYPSMTLNYLGSEITDFSKYTLSLNGKPYGIDLESMLLNKKVPDPDPEPTSSSDDPDPTSSSEEPSDISSSSVPVPSDISSSETSSSSTSTSEDPIFGKIMVILGILVLILVISAIGWLTYRHLKLKGEILQQKNSDVNSVSFSQNNTIETIEDRERSDSNSSV